MPLAISQEEIINLVKNNQIDSKFKYLTDANVMYIAIKENPDLISLIEASIINKIVRLFNLDNELDDNKRLVLFKKLIYYFDDIPNKYVNLIKDKETYLDLASDMTAYIKLCNLPHPFKQEEKDLFFNKYEKQYIFNPENPLKYAKDSELVLYNTLKRNSINIYYISFFNNSAISDRIIEYIDANNLTNNINMPAMYDKFPKIVLLKLKKNLNFIFSVDPNCIDDTIIEYLKSINFNVNYIEEYINKHQVIPLCLKNPKLILYFLQDNIDNIKYLDGNKLSDELIKYLNEHDYVYKKGHNKVLLTNDLIYKNFLLKGDLNILFHDNIELSIYQIDLLIKHIDDNNIIFPDIKNKYLLNNKVFNDFMASTLKKDNPYNLDNKYLITSLGRSLTKLSKIFDSSSIEIIIREILMNNYFIDISSIFNNISLDKFKDIYDNLSKKENKFNDKFDFYYFIKICEYLSNNLELTKELNDHEINDLVITNLALAINRSDLVNYETILRYQEYLKENILNDNVGNKAVRLLLNYDPLYSSFFLDDIINIPDLIYLQLDYSLNSLEYNILESYIDLITVIKSGELTNEILSNITLSPLFDINVMKKNILKLYSRMYKKISFNPNNYKDKTKVIGNSKIIDITGSDFTFFVHDDNFNNQDDFTNPDTKERTTRNYICTSFSSELLPYGLNSKMHVYDLENDNSLIAFGNQDINIDYLKAPLFSSSDHFVNPIDMAFSSNKPGYVPNEFDFLRYNDSNQEIETKYKIVNSYEEALKVKNYEYVLIFDEIKHMEVMEQRFNNMCLNINNLSFKDLYKLIALTSRYQVSDNLVLEIIEKIKKMSIKEQIVLNSALDKYKIARNLNKKNIGKH